MINKMKGTQVKRGNSGFTLMELLISIAIIGIFATMALPAMNSLYTSNKVYGLSERVQAEIAWARTQAILTSEPVTLSFNPVAQWCYGFENISAQVGCDCSNPNDCLVDGTEKINNVLAFDGTTLATTLAANNITFDSRGIANINNSSITLTDTNNNSVVLNLNALGRVSPCSNALPHYDACP